MTKDDNLLRLFQIAAPYAPDGACTFTHDYSRHFVCRSCVYIDPDVDPKLKEDQCYPVACAANGKLLQVSDMHKCAPDVLLSDKQIYMDDGLLEACTSNLLKVRLMPFYGSRDIGSGLFVFDKTTLQMLHVKQSDKCAMQQVGILPYAFPPWCAVWLRETNTSLSDYGPMLAFTRLGGMMVQELFGETSVAYFALMMVSDEAYIERLSVEGVTLEGVGYVGNGWNAEKRTFKSVIRKGDKMKGLGNPLKRKLAMELAEENKAAETAQDQSAPETAAVVEPAGAQAHAQTEEDTPPFEQESAADAPQEDTREAAAAEQGTQVEQTSAAATEPPAKKTRARRASASAGFDFSAVLEHLSSQPTPIEGSYDAVLEELRNIRDLQIAAARRAANLSVELWNSAKTAVDKWASVQALLK